MFHARSARFKKHQSKINSGRGTGSLQRSPNFLAICPSARIPLVPRPSGPRSSVPHCEHRSTPVADRPYSTL